jgi:hypothetical protein
MSSAYRQKLYKKIDEWEREVLTLLGTLLREDTNDRITPFTVQFWADSRLELLAGLRQKLKRMSNKLYAELVPEITRELGPSRARVEKELRELLDTAEKQLAICYRKAVLDIALWVSLGYMSFSAALRWGSDNLADLGAAGRVADQKRYALRGLVELITEDAYYVERLAEIIRDPDTEYVEISAHYGARPSHAEWQGGIYKIHGSTPQYPNLIVVTGYGSPQGLGGYGCRHYAWPFIPGISIPQAPVIDRELNDKIYALQQKANRHARRAAQWGRREIVAKAQDALATATKYRAQGQYHLNKLQELQGIIAKAMPINSQRER